MCPQASTPDPFQLFPATVCLGFQRWTDGFCGCLSCRFVRRRDAPFPCGTGGLGGVLCALSSDQGQPTLGLIRFQTARRLGGALRPRLFLGSDFCHGSDRACACALLRLCRALLPPRVASIRVPTGLLGSLFFWGVVSH